MEEIRQGVRLEGRSEIEADREPQVHGELGGMDDALNDLGLIVEQLEGRLRCVTRDDDLPGLLETAEKERVLVTVAERVRGQRYSARAISRRLSSLLDRLEV